MNCLSCLSLDSSMVSSETEDLVRSSKVRFKNLEEKISTDTREFYLKPEVVLVHF